MAMTEATGSFPDFQINNGASDELIGTSQAALGVVLPHDYLEFLRRSNGGEGFIGSKYLMLWRIEELASFNEAYEVKVYAPGLLLFGSNGGGEAYAFDTRGVHWAVVRVPFVGMDLADAESAGSSFSEFLENLRKWSE